MKMEKEMKYETPKVEVLEVEVENGFLSSDENNNGDGGGIEGNL